MFTLYFTLSAENTLWIGIVNFNRVANPTLSDLFWLDGTPVDTAALPNVNFVMGNQDKGGLETCGLFKRGGSSASAEVATIELGNKRCSHRLAYACQFDCSQGNPTSMITWPFL